MSIGLRAEPGPSVTEKLERNGMHKIPHGKTLDERRSYANKLKKVAASCYEEGRWKVMRADQNVVLVEVWEQARKVSIHPSRNRFFWVQDPQQRRKLHALATDPNKMSMFQSGAAALAARRPAPAPKPHPKSLAAPIWARETDLIGYTSINAIQFVGDGISIKGLQSYPSIYYKNGHATIDHLKPGNIGWEYGTNWTCLFFGNVPKQFV